LQELFKEFRTFQSQLNILHLFQQSAIALFLLGSKVETKQTQGLTQLQRTKVILRFFFTFPTKHTNKQTHKQTNKQNTQTNKTHKQTKNFLGKRSLDRISLDRNCHFSLDRKF